MTRFNYQYITSSYLIFLKSIAIKIFILLSLYYILKTNFNLTNL